MHTLVLTFSTFLLVWHHSTPTQLSSQEKPDFSMKMQLNQMNEDYLPDCCPKAKFPPSPCHFPVLSHEDSSLFTNTVFPPALRLSYLCFNVWPRLSDSGSVYTLQLGCYGQSVEYYIKKQTNKQMTKNPKPPANQKQAFSHTFKKFILMTFRKQVRWLKDYFKIRKKNQYLSPPPFNILKSQVAWSFTSLSSSSAEWPIYFLGEEL